MNSVNIKVYFAFQTLNQKVIFLKDGSIFMKNINLYLIFILQTFQIILQ